MNNGHAATWEHRRAELWERIFQVTQDVVTLSEDMGDTPGTDVMRSELIRAAMDVGKFLARGTAANTQAEFEKNIEEARLKAIESDYWLRLAYIIQQQDEVQRDLSSIITQYSSIVDLLHKLSRHVKEARDVGAHTKGPKVNL